MLCGTIGVEFMHPIPTVAVDPEHAWRQPGPSTSGAFSTCLHPRRRFRDGAPAAPPGKRFSLEQHCATSLGYEILDGPRSWGRQSGHGHGHRGHQT
jgi:hypothetical protein